MASWDTRTALPAAPWAQNLHPGCELGLEMLNLVVLGACWSYKRAQGQVEGSAPFPWARGDISEPHKEFNLVVRRMGKPPPHCRPLCPSELYSYTEEPEFGTNRRCFEEDFRTQGTGSGLSTRWRGAAPTQPAPSWWPWSWSCPLRSAGPAVAGAGRGAAEGLRHAPAGWAGGGQQGQEAQGGAGHPVPGAG